MTLRLIPLLALLALPAPLLRAADFRVESVQQSEKVSVASVLFRLRNDSLKAELKITLAKDEFWLRKQLVLTALHPLVLEWVEPEALSVPGAYQPWQLKEITADAPYHWKPGLGQPLYGRTNGTFWGVEFPAADNTVKGDAISCGYLCGRKLDAGETYSAHPSVMRVADDPAFVQDAFFNYIGRTRAPFPDASHRRQHTGNAAVWVAMRRAREI